MFETPEDVYGALMQRVERIDQLKKEKAILFELLEEIVNSNPETTFSLAGENQILLRVNPLTYKTARTALYGPEPI